ncbi:MAG: ribosome biogenesis GTP-binding protein YihA/YsxC [Alphaproteobacteria bacterium]
MNETWKFIDEVHEFRNLPDDDVREIVFWGRSNVGKSSLINSFTKSSIAKTSKTPGRTRSLVLFQLNKKIRIVDFPGYGYSRIPKTKENKLNELVDNYIRKRTNLFALCLLIDSHHGFKKMDKIILDQLNCHIQDKIIIVFTKIDKLKSKGDKEALNELNNLTASQLNKNFFNTSIKEINTIILFKKFMMNSL